MLTREVNAWLCRLDDATFGRVAYHLDMVAERGVHLGGERSRPLRWGQPIRQLTIPDGRRSHRLTYCSDGDGTIVVLTVCRWWRPARWELHRARDAIARHHGHYRPARAAGACRRRRWPARLSGRGWSGWWHRQVRGRCDMGRTGPWEEGA